MHSSSALQSSAAAGHFPVRLYAITAGDTAVSDSPLHHTYLRLSFNDIIPFPVEKRSAMVLRKIVAERPSGCMSLHLVEGYSRDGYVLMARPFSANTSKK
jgi:hypothetical protein